MQIRFQGIFEFSSQKKDKVLDAFKELKAKHPVIVAAHFPPQLQQDSFESPTDPVEALAAEMAKAFVGEYFDQHKVIALTDDDACNYLKQHGIQVDTTQSKEAIPEQIKADLQQKAVDSSALFSYFLEQSLLGEQEINSVDLDAPTETK